jgi:hypothetical protein
MAILLVATGIPVSRFYGICARETLSLLGFAVCKIPFDVAGIEYHLTATIKKKPLRQRRRGLLL